ncbi:hypothetical protein HYT56_05530 [Candidatus Woesearchaeota archaeon]|nr:hypothetical protein [Candidatus Woesearchaeota archaeon]
MATFTVSVSKEIKEIMDRHPEINWSAYVKKMIEERLRQLKKFKELVERGEI